MRDSNPHQQRGGKRTLDQAVSELPTGIRLQSHTETRAWAVTSAAFRLSLSGKGLRAKHNIFKEPTEPPQLATPVCGGVERN